MVPDNCFEEIAGWRTTLATTGRSDALDNLRRMHEESMIPLGRE
jgi:hypothetical protein